MKGHFLTSLFILITTFSFAQNYIVSGVVSDSATKEPLAFVNILINNSQKGGMTDINGTFYFVQHEPVKFLRLSYVGYNPQVFLIETDNTEAENQNLKIRLTRQSVPLSEVTIVAGENPAHRIIRNVVNNRRSNDPKYYQNYKYTSYDKMIYRATIDSLTGKRLLAKGDSSMIRLRKVMSTQHAFIMEDIAEQQFTYPDGYYSKVIASRASGIKDPSFFFLMSHSQPNSFYDEVIKLGLKSYINPIVPDFQKLYTFLIRDTIISESGLDTTFIISFEKAKGKNFESLSGLLYINSAQWAISNVIAQPTTVSDGLEFKIQQQYKLINGTHWFPVQLNIELTMYNYAFKPFIPIGIGSSYRTNIIIDSPVIEKNSENITVDVESNAGERSEIFWNQYRIDSLNSFDKNTYRLLDSLQKTGRLGFIDKLSSLAKGRLPLGKIYLNIGETYRTNKYERYYFGAGIYTSDKLSKAGSIGGYVGYGIKDKEFKYGGSIRLNLKKYDDFFLKLSYDHNIEESAGIRYSMADVNQFVLSNYRVANVERFDKVESIGATATFRLFRYFLTETGIMHAKKRAMYDYAWMQNAGDILIPTNEYNFGYYSVCSRFAFREKFIRASNDEMSMGTKYPVVWLQYTAARKGFLNGEHSLDKFDVKFSYSRFTKLIGLTSLTIQGGLVTSQVPYSELYSGFGSGTNFFAILSKNSFTTMEPSEFLSDRYAAIFFKHNFGKLLMNSKYIQPEFSILINAGAGSLNNPEKHVVNNLKTMELGYYEAGIMIDHFFKHTFSTVGIGAFYRMGPYSYDDPLSNIVLRIGLLY